MYAVQVENLVKQYKNGVQALSGLTLSVRQGELFSLLGQNGAGKSTLIRILTTYLKPTSGSVTMFGKDICREAAAVRREVACVSQQTSIDTYLSLEENMLFQSRLYRIPRSAARDRMETLIDAFGLAEYRSYPVSSYSGGIKRRLDIALNLMSNPKLLFLDEPTVGMDLQSRRLMWEMIRKIRSEFGTTVFLTTHYLEEADQLSDNICIMRDGREVVQGTPYELRAYTRQNMVRIHVHSAGAAGEYLPRLKACFPDRKVSAKGAQIAVHTQEDQSDMARAARFLLREEIPFSGIEVAQPTLEDVFLRFTTDGEEGIK